MKILTALVGHSHNCRAKAHDKFGKAVARNWHASEILASAIDIYISNVEDLNSNLSLGFCLTFEEEI